MGTHPIEPELLGAIPRKVESRPGMGRGVGIGCASVFILPHTAVGFVLAGMFVLAVLHAAFGHEVEGRSTGVTVSHGKKGLTYSVGVAWDEGGVTRTSSQSISAADQARYASGTPLRLKVFSLGPFDRGDIAGTDGGMPWPVALFIALFWNGICSVFWYILWIRPLLWRRLVARGVPIAGRVVSKREESGRRSRSYYVKYEYAPQFGAPLVREMTVSGEAYALANHGEPVTVLYDENKPKRSLIYPYAPYRAA